jgi:hypothetical protein
VSVTVSVSPVGRMSRAAVCVAVAFRVAVPVPVPVSLVLVDLTVIVPVPVPVSFVFVGFSVTVLESLSLSASLSSPRSPMLVSVLRRPAPRPSPSPSPSSSSSLGLGLGLAVGAGPLFPVCGGLARMLLGAAHARSRPSSTSRVHRSPSVQRPPGRVVALSSAFAPFSLSLLALCRRRSWQQPLHLQSHDNLSNVPRVHICPKDAPKIWLARSAVGQARNGDDVALDEGTGEDLHVLLSDVVGVGLKPSEEGGVVALFVVLWLVLRLVLVLVLVLVHGGRSGIVSVLAVPVPVPMMFVQPPRLLAQHPADGRHYFLCVVLVNANILQQGRICLHAAPHAVDGNHVVTCKQPSNLLQALDANGIAVRGQPRRQLFHVTLGLGVGVRVPYWSGGRDGH